MRGEPNPVLRSHLCVSQRLRRWREGDDAGEEDARVLRYRADASAMKFAPPGLAWPFRDGSPILDLNTKMMHIFPQKKQNDDIPSLKHVH